MKVKTLADAIQVKTTTAIHNSQTYPLDFPPHGLKVDGNKDKVYYVERFERVELQNIRCMMSGFELKFDRTH